MIAKVNTEHVGVMTLKNGTALDYKAIRVTRTLSKMIFYTGKGLRELFKPGMNEEEMTKAAQLKELDEKTLMRMGYIAAVPLTSIEKMD